MIKVQVAISMDRFPVNREGDRAILLSCCFGVKIGIGPSVSISMVNLM